MPAYYAGPVSEFLEESTSSIVGKLADGIPREGFLELRSSQITVWTPEIYCLKEVFVTLLGAHPEVSSWSIILEFPIPRRGRRVDAIILTSRCAFVLEFKSEQSDAQALRQVEGYALDLADFHRPSHQLHLVPILVSASKRELRSAVSDSRVASAESTTPQHLADVLWMVFSGARCDRHLSNDERP